MPYKRCCSYAESSKSCVAPLTWPSKPYQNDCSFHRICHGKSHGLDRQLCLTLTHTQDMEKQTTGARGYVLNTIKNGYTLQFAHIPPHFNGMVMSEVQALFLRAEIHNLLTKGAVEVVSLCNGCPGFGVWTDTERGWHINCLELMHFTSSQELLCLGSPQACPHAHGNGGVHKPPRHLPFSPSSLAHDEPVEVGRSTSPVYSSCPFPGYLSCGADMLLGQKGGPHRISPLISYTRSCASSGRRGRRCC